MNSLIDKVRYFQVRPAISYGLGAIEEIGKYRFKKVCICTDESVVKFGLLDMLTEVLDKNQIVYHVFDEVKPEPPIDIVASGIVHLRQDQPDAIIAIGGGSVIDAAKAVIYYTKEMTKDPADFKKPFFIALPTTAGTGSEVSEWSVITDEELNTKVPIGDPTLMPDVALLEPRLIESMPPSVTAASGMDAFTHAIESYISTESNPFSKAQSVQAIELLCDNLVKTYVDGHDLEARAHVQVASCMAAIAFTSSFLGIAHSIAHAIGSQWHYSHGEANAMALPYVLAFNGQNPETDKAYEHLLHAIGRGYLLKDAKSPTEAVVKMVFKMNADMAIPLSLKADGVDEADYLAAKALLIEKAMGDVCTPTNPIPATPEIIGQVLDMLYYGK